MRVEPLYRKVNTRARGVHHDQGPRFRHERNRKGHADDDHVSGSMHQGRRRGLDYTPLFRFLLASIGRDWNDVYAAARPRLDREEPLYWLVARAEHQRRRYVRIGESSWYSGLYVDGDNRLQRVDPQLTPAAIGRQCRCCTHTLDGVPFPDEPG